MASLRQVFQLDPRGLALLRISLGLLIFLKLAHLIPNLGLVFADDGILPRSVLAQVRSGVWVDLSIYAWFGSVEWIGFVVVAHMAVALAFAAGWKTRWMTLLLWFLTISLNARNPFITNAGDKLTVLLLFWSLFLPLGRVWSIDSRSPRTPGPRERFMATAAGVCLILQIMAVYLMSGHAKTHYVWTIDFSAVEHALSNDSYSTAFGKYLLAYPLLLKFLTVATVYLEQLFVLLLLSPYYHNLLRTLVCFGFIGFHLGIALTINIGTFPFICAAAWLALLPPAFFNGSASVGAACSGVRTRQASQPSLNRGPPVAPKDARPV